MASAKKYGLLDSYIPDRTSKVISEFKLHFQRDMDHEGAKNSGLFTKCWINFVPLPQHPKKVQFE